MESRRCIFAGRMRNSHLVQRWIPPVLDVSALGLVMLLPLWFPRWHFLAWPWTMTGLAVLMPGMILMATAFFQFVRYRTTLRFDQPGKLITSGVYRRTRNPMYLGKFLALLGLAVLLGHALSLLIAPLHMMLINKLVVPKEEQLLEDTFGGIYQAYKARVGRWWPGRTRSGDQ